jgi:hypothetical protein
LRQIARREVGKVPCDTITDKSQDLGDLEALARHVAKDSDGVAITGRSHGRRNGPMSAVRANYELAA